MADKMMLKQVRDVLEYVRSTCFTLEDGSRVFCGDMADAIDAHLNAAKGETVYQIECDDQWVDVDSVTYEGHDGSDKRILYTHPASPDVVRDAERYRWLRDEGDSTWNPLVKRKSSWTTKQVDAAIDAAMVAREGGE